MELKTHIAAKGSGAQGWGATMLALGALVGMLLALESGLLHNNPFFKRLVPSSVIRSRDGVPDRVSLDLHLLSPSNDPARRYSVAHPLLANVTSSQLFSIALDSRTAFEIYGETAHSELIADERTAPEIQPRNDRLMLMLMLLRIHERRD
jgi:hypothetical protein